MPMLSHRPNYPLSFATNTATRMEHMLIPLFVLLVPLNIVYASPCTDLGRVAVSEVTRPGTSYIECNLTDGTCLPEGTSSNGTAHVIAQCINIDGVKACGLAGAQMLHHSEACGVYVGPTASRFASLHSGSAVSPLPIDVAAWHVLANWPNLGYVNILATCCSTTSCYVTQLTLLHDNECDPGYSTVKCAGDEHHGVCSSWIGDGDSGQYFLVNADVPLPHLSDILNASSAAPPGTTPISPTLSGSGATASPGATGASRGERVPAWAIALLCVLGVALSALSLLFARHVRAVRKIGRGQWQIDPASASVPAPDPLIMHPTGAFPEMQAMNRGDLSPEDGLAPPQYTKGMLSA